MRFNSDDRQEWPIFNEATKEEGWSIVEGSEPRLQDYEATVQAEIVRVSKGDTIAEAGFLGRVVFFRDLLATQFAESVDVMEFHSIDPLEAVQVDLGLSFIVHDEMAGFRDISGRPLRGEFIPKAGFFYTLPVLMSREPDTLAGDDIGGREVLSWLTNADFDADQITEAFGSERPLAVLRDSCSKEWLAAVKSMPIHDRLATLERLAGNKKLKRFNPDHLTHGLVQELLGAAFDEFAREATIESLMEFEAECGLPYE